MKDFKKQIKALPEDIFEQINTVLKKNGLESAQVNKIRIQATSKRIHCAEDEEEYCWYDVTGKVECMCIKRMESSL